MNRPRGRHAPPDLLYGSRKLIARILLRFPSLPITVRHSSCIWEVVVLVKDHPSPERLNEFERAQTDAALAKRFRIVILAIDG